MAPEEVTDNRLWILIARKLADECTPDELIELELLLEVNPDIIDCLEVLARLWKVTPKRGHAD